MTTLPIAYYGKRVLRHHGKDVLTIDQGLKELALNMIESMKINKGIGLAAQQVSRLERIIVINLSLVDETQEPFALFNPEVVSASRETCVINEGCLSFPGLRLDIKRPVTAVVKALDIEGNPVEIFAEGMQARVLMHEIDHTIGKLFIDYIHPLKRKFILKQWEKTREQD